MQDIVVTDLSKQYQDKPVLRNFNAVFPAARTTCVMGASGCGKTTLLHILLGLTTSDGGRVEGLPKKLSAVFQEDRLCESFSALANAGLAAPHTPPSTVLRHLEAVGLAGCARTPVAQLSGGMKRRVALVRAVLAEGDALLLDEPFKGLDEATRASTAAYLRANTQGRTVIVVTHSPEEVALLDGGLIHMEPCASAPGAGHMPPRRTASAASGAACATPC